MRKAVHKEVGNRGAPGAAPRTGFAWGVEWLFAWAVASLFAIKDGPSGAIARHGADRGLAILPRSLRHPEVLR